MPEYKQIFEKMEGMEMEILKEVGVGKVFIAGYDKRIRSVMKRKSIPKDLDLDLDKLVERFCYEGREVEPIVAPPTNGA